MKTAHSLVTMLFLARLSSAEPLSDADRAALLKKIETVTKETKESSESRLKSALTAFQSARTSNEGAVALYLKCVEEVDYNREGKPASAFRDWKQNSEGLLKDKGFQIALRHQINWLVIAIETKYKMRSGLEVTDDAVQSITAIITEHEDIKKHLPWLEKNDAFKSVFARTYNLRDIQPKDFPISPIPIKTAYDKFILPALRDPKANAALRKVWTTRIQQERELVERNYKESKDTEGAAQAAKFSSDTLPQLRWDMEKDLYKAGDQQAAAQNMYELIAANIGHPSSKAWVGEFQALLKPKTKDEKTEESKPEGNPFPENPLAE